MAAFDWDTANVSHILRHWVTPFEVGRTREPPPPDDSHEDFQTDERRWKLLGKTVANRYLVVVFTIRRKLFRTVTAYDMNEIGRAHV